MERLCRYVNRPPLAYGCLQPLDSGDLAFAPKTPWDNGTTHRVFEPLEFIGRLAALTPPPRRHLIRYHGVLASHATDRALIVPSASHAPEDDAQPSVGQTPAENASPSAHPTPPRSTPMTWARLLARVFLADALLCLHGGARLPWVAVLTDPSSIRTYLTGVGLPAEAPTIAPPRSPPQQELDFDY